MASQRGASNALGSSCQALQGREEINEGGFLLAVDGRVLPHVFVGTAEIDEAAGRSGTAATLAYDETDLFRAIAKFDGGRLDYNGVEELNPRRVAAGRALEQAAGYRPAAEMEVVA